MFKYLVSLISSSAWSRNLVTVTSFDLAKYFVMARSSCTDSNC